MSQPIYKKCFAYDAIKCIKETHTSCLGWLGFLLSALLSNKSNLIFPKRIFCKQNPKTEKRNGLHQRLASVKGSKSECFQKPTSRNYNSVNTQCVITNIYSTCQLITRDRSGSRVEVCERFRFGIFLQRQFIAERLISCEFFLSAIFPVSTLKKEPWWNIVIQSVSLVWMTRLTISSYSDST